MIVCLHVSCAHKMRTNRKFYAMYFASQWQMQEMNRKYTTHSVIKKFYMIKAHWMSICGNISFNYVIIFCYCYCYSSTFSMLLSLFVLFFFSFFCIYFIFSFTFERCRFFFFFCLALILFDYTVNIIHLKKKCDIKWIYLQR